MCGCGFGRRDRCGIGGGGALRAGRGGDIGGERGLDRMTSRRGKDILEWEWFGIRRSRWR